MREVSLRQGGEKAAVALMSLGREECEGGVPQGKTLESDLTGKGNEQGEVGEQDAAR